MDADERDRLIAHYGRLSSKRLLKLVASLNIEYKDRPENLGDTLKRLSCINQVLRRRGVPEERIVAAEISNGKDNIIPFPRKRKKRS